MHSSIEDEKLKQLIADSVETIEAEERKRQAIANAQQIELNQLLQAATVAALADVSDLPPALLPYCIAAHGPGAHSIEANMITLKKGWRPEYFYADAPGLTRISFRVQWTGGKRQTSSISFLGFNGTTSSWPLVIGKAALRYRELQEDEQRENSFNEMSYRASQRQPTTAERLEGLIRAIAREEQPEQE
jgi:hypothetical protein